MAAESVNRSVNIYINSGEAQKAYDVLIAKEKNLNAELAKTTDPKRIRALKQDLEKLGEPISRAAKKLSGELGPSLREQQALVKKLGHQLNHMSTTDANFKPMVQQLDQANRELQEMYVLTGKVKGAQAGIAKTNPFGSVVNFAKGAFLAGGAIAVVQQFTQFLGDSLDEALDAEEATARFRATLENLDKGDAFDRIIRKADELAEKFKYLDNDDIVGVFNKLIDYGKLTEKQMNDLLPVIINFAAKQRISITDATTAIVSGLEGQGKALKQYGINIKDAGSDTERLSVIMNTLGEKVEGAGDAFQNSAAGKLAVYKQEVANLQEEIGQGLIPVLTGLLRIINQTGAGFGQMFTKIQRFIAASQGAEALQAFDAAQDKIERDAAIAGAKSTPSNIPARQAQRLREKYAKEGKTDADIVADLKKEASFRRAIEGAGGKTNLKEYEALLNIFDPQALGSAGDNTKSKGSGGGTKRDVVGDDLKKLYKELRQLQLDHSLFQLDEFEKEVAKAKEKYDRLRELAHGNAAAMKAIAQEEAVELSRIREKQIDAQIASIQKGIASENAREAAAAKEKLQKHEALVTKMFATLGNIQTESAEKQEATRADRVAGIQLQKMKANGKERLQLEKQLLDEEEKQALAAKGLTENQKLLIQAEFQAKRDEAESNHQKKQIDQLFQYADAAIGILSMIDAAKTAKENSEIARDQKVNDTKKKNLEKQLKGKLITQQEYDRKVDAMDKELEKKKQQAEIKQFKRSQRMQIIQAIMNGAMAVTSTLAAIPGPVDIATLGTARIIQMAIATAMTAAQVATIASQKPPQFARGGRLSGRSHANGGMPVLDHHGRKQAEVEGGESIINKRTMADRRIYQVEGTPSQIASRLNGMHGVSWETGATLRPTWRTAPARMNFAAINRMYASGGVFGSGSSESGSDQASMQMLAELATSVNNLNSILAGGITAVASLTQFNTQQSRLDAIKNDATMR